MCGGGVYHLALKIQLSMRGSVDTKMHFKSGHFFRYQVVVHVQVTTTTTFKKCRILSIFVCSTVDLYFSNFSAIKLAHRLCNFVCRHITPKSGTERVVFLVLRLNVWCVSSSPKNSIIDARLSWATHHLLTRQRCISKVGTFFKYQVVVHVQATTTTTT